MYGLTFKTLEIKKKINCQTRLSLQWTSFLLGVILKLKTLFKWQATQTIN